MVFYTVFYLVFFSAIRHKEIRFLLPLIPFCMLMIAEALTAGLHKFPAFTTFYVKGYIVFEVALLLFYETFKEAGWVIRRDLMLVDPPISSVFLADRFTAPNYSLLHRQE